MITVTLVTVLPTPAANKKILKQLHSQVNTRVGPPFNGYLIHKLILEQQNNSLAHIIRILSDNPATRLDLEVPSLIDKNTALHLAVSVCSEQLVKVNFCPRCY